MPLAGVGASLATTMQVEHQGRGSLRIVILRDEDGILVVVFLDGAVFVRVVVKLAGGVVGGCCKAGQGEKTAEQQADAFAAYLLMPSKLINEAYIKAFGETSEVFDIGYKKRHMLGSIASRVIDAGDFDNVSLTAMTNRLIGMKLITGVSYQKYVMPDISPKTIKGLWKYYISMINKGVKRLLKTDD